MLSAVIPSVLGYPALLLAEQLVHQWHVQPGPLVLGSALLNLPTPTADRDRTVSRRSEPSSRTALTGEQPDPWDLLQPQDAVSRHRKPRYITRGWTIPSPLLKIEIFKEGCRRIGPEFLQDPLRQKSEKSLRGHRQSKGFTLFAAELIPYLVFRLPTELPMGLYFTTGFSVMSRCYLRRLNSLRSTPIC